MKVYTYEQCVATYRGGPGAYGDQHVHAMSALAEQHAAIVLGLPWDLMTKENDPGWDLEMGPIHINVKWTDKKARNGVTHLPVKLEPEYRDSVHLYVLVTGREANNLRLNGFATQERVDAAIEAKAGFPMTDKGGMRAGKKSWMVPETALMPIVDLFSVAQAKWPDLWAQYIEAEYPRSAWEIET